MAMLHELKKLVKRRKRVGRGGSRGGTSGKGHKGQKARSGGYVRIGYEGGQMPLYRRLPKRGFNNDEFKKTIKTINLQDLESSFDNGAAVTLSVLKEKGLVRFCDKAKERVLLKVLGKGTLTKKLDVLADLYSKSAEKAIQQCGGQARVNKEI